MTETEKYNSKKQIIGRKITPISENLNIIDMNFAYL
jgi:hypothetical protein